jgi:predicted glycosyltransferase
MMTTSASAQRCVRMVLYSHDTMGLGHMRRSLLIAQALSRGGREATVLLVCGSVQASSFIIPPGVDCLTLPALHKSASGSYDSRRLELPLNGIMKLRSQTIRAAVRAFEPDLLVTDNVPRGALGELEPALEDLAAAGVPCVLGLRDILDEPEAVAREWARAGNEQAIRDYYRAVWVYGDRALYDIAAEYGFSAETRQRLRYVGYLDQRPRLAPTGANGSPSPTDLVPSGPFALCTVGGGQDGLELADAFARSRAPVGVRRLVLVGPEMDAGGRRQLHEQARQDPDLSVVDFVTEPGHLVKRAGCMVTMGGYNTVCEALSFRKRALVVPRVTPRREQLIRAERFRERGLLDVLHPHALAPELLSSWVRRNFGRPGRPSRGHVHLGGPGRLRAEAREILGLPPNGWSQRERDGRGLAAQRAS